MKKIHILKNPVLLTGTMAVLSLLILGQILTLSQLKNQQTNQGSAQVVQWHATQSATTSCNTNGQAVISTSFINEETTNDIDVLAKDNQTGNTLDLGTIKAGTSKNGQIATQLSALNSGSVVFALTWSNGQNGQDSRTANYSAIQCAQPSTTPSTVSSGPTVTPTVTISPTPSCSGVNCPAVTRTQLTLSNANLNPNTCSYSPDTGYICKTKIILNQINIASLNTSSIDWTTNLEGNIATTTVSPDHGTIQVNTSQSAIVTLPVANSCVTTTDATESITFFDRNNPTDNVVAVFTCGKAVSPNKGILITTDQANYHPQDSISVVVSNTMSVPIYAANRKAGCSILNLESLSNGHWTISTQAQCGLNLPTVITRIDPGQNYTAIIKPTQVQGFVPDIYRFGLKYATNPTDAVAQPITKDSSSFIVQGNKCLPHPICLDSVTACHIPNPSLNWCPQPAPKPTPTAGPTVVVPTLYCLGSCPTTPPTVSPTIMASTIPSTSPSTGSGPTAIPTTGGVSPTLVTSIAPTQSPCGVTQSVTSSHNKKSKHTHKKNSDGLIDKLEQLIKKLLGGNNGGIPTPTPTPTPSVTPCPSSGPTTPLTSPSTTTSATPITVSGIPSTEPTTITISSSPSQVPVPTPNSNDFLKSILAFILNLFQIILQLILSLFGIHQ